VSVLVSWLDGKQQIHKMRCASSMRGVQGVVVMSYNFLENANAAELSGGHCQCAANIRLLCQQQQCLDPQVLGYLVQLYI
jgi:hypothetical protein